MPFINCVSPQTDQITLSLNGSVPSNATNVTYNLVSGGGVINGTTYQNTNPVDGNNTIVIERCYQLQVVSNCEINVSSTTVSLTNNSATAVYTNNGSETVTVMSTQIAPGQSATIEDIPVFTEGTQKKRCADVSCKTTSVQDFCETETCLVEVQSQAQEFRIVCDEQTITDPKQPLSIAIEDPDANANREYITCINGCPASASSSTTSLTTNALSSYIKSGVAGSLNVEVKYYENGDRCNLIKPATGADCVVNHDTTSCAYVYSSAVNVTNNGSTSSPYLRHFYSTRSSFNADSTCIVLQEGVTEGQTLADTHKVYDLQGNFKYTLPFNRDVIWSRYDPDKSYGVINQNNTSSLACYDSSTGQTTILYSQSYVQGEIFEIGARKSALSYDETCAVINDEENIKVLDLCTGQVTAQMSSSVLSNGGNVSGSGTSLYVSPKCNYILMFEQDANGSEDLYRYDIDLTNRTLLTTNGNHFDVGLDHNLNEVLVQVGNPPQMIDLATGAVTNLWTGSAFGHVSASGAPGQFVFSSNISGDRKILEVCSSDGTNGFVNGVEWGDLGDYNATNFRSQRKVSVSPDGCHVIYTEGPDSTSNAHDDFIISRSCSGGTTNDCVNVANITGCPTGTVSVPSTLNLLGVAPAGQTYVAGPFFQGGATLNGVPITPNTGNGQANNPIIDQPGEWCFEFRAELSGGGFDCGTCCFTAV